MSGELAIQVAAAMVRNEAQLVREFVELNSFDKQEEHTLKSVAAKRAAGPQLYEALCDLVDAAAEGDPRKHPQWDSRYAAAIAAIKQAEELL